MVSAVTVVDDVAAARRSARTPATLELSPRQPALFLRRRAEAVVRRSGAPPSFHLRAGLGRFSAHMTPGRAFGQNQSFTASCTTRGSRALVIVPKLAGP